MKSLLTDPNEIKIFILYLLDKIGYPLDYPSIGVIMMQDKVIDFVDFAECFFALVEAGHINEIYPDGDGPEADDSPDDPDVIPFDGVEEEYSRDAAPENEERIPRKLYEVSEKGHKVAVGLGGSIMSSVREMSYRSALRHLSLKKRGAKIEKSCSPDGEGYLVKCRVTDKDGIALDLTLRADSKYQVERMMKNIDERPEVIFRGIVALLSGDVNFVFEL
ncbi:MAG: DUF4364 family protein [Clostridia bacterium]|nr:DUF4364 family protein [Clostridia bacterium]